MAEPMKIRATLVGDKVDVRVRIEHEMETGQRKDASGKAVPAWFIQNISATCNGKTVMSAQWGTAVSKNPSIAFRFSGGKVGDKVIVTWVDNKGTKQTNEAVIAAA